MARPAGRSASRIRPSVSISAQAATRRSFTRQPLRLTSRPVIAVDRHIFLGEIAGEHAVAPGPDPERYLQFDDLLLHLGRDVGFVIGRIAHALVGDPDAVEPDRQQVAVGRFARLSDRHDDAAPIGVFAGDCGFHQRRIGDRHRDAPRRLCGFRALDDHLDELAGALAVAGDLLGERFQHRIECGDEALEPRVAGAFDRWGAMRRGRAGGERQQRVRGRGVAVDRHRIEAVGNPLLQQGLQHRRRNRRVGEHEGQHGGHVGRDHAGALGDAADRHHGVAELCGLDRALGKRVGGHDRPRGRLEIAGLGGGDEVIHDAVEGSGVERFADHPRGGEEHFARLALGRLAGAGGGVFCRLPPAAPGKRIRIAGIHHQRARLAGRDLVAAPIDRRRRAFRLGEHTRDRGTLVEQHRQYVGAPLVADAGGPGGKANARNRRYFRKVRGGERRHRCCHDGPPCE